MKSILISLENELIISNNSLDLSIWAKTELILSAFSDEMHLNPLYASATALHLSGPPNSSGFLSQLSFIVEYWRSSQRSSFPFSTISIAANAGILR